MKPAGPAVARANPALVKSVVEWMARAASKNDHELMATRTVELLHKRQLGRPLEKRDGARTSSRVLKDCAEGMSLFMNPYPTETTANFGPDFYSIANDFSEIVSDFNTALVTVDAVKTTYHNR